MSAAAALQCHRCGYDLRAQPQDGQCPECGASVVESKRLAAIPRRPAWRESDPRWRRRILAGAWLLVLLPLMDVLRGLGWSSRIPVPTVYDSLGTVNSLEDTFLCSTWGGVYQPVVFCIGVVMLFSKERGRRHNALDWTRRWGILCSYVVFLLSATQVLFITALVVTGIGGLFLSMASKYQPESTLLFVNLGWGYLRCGPQPMNGAGLVLVAFSSIAILLACVPLFNALRSSGPKWAAAILLAPLPVFSVLNLAEIFRYCLGSPGVTVADATRYALFFSPQLLVREFADDPTGWYYPQLSPGAFTMEAAKWCIVLAIAIWLSIARLVTWRRGTRTTSTLYPPAKMPAQRSERGGQA